MRNFFKCFFGFFKDKQKERIMTQEVIDLSKSEYWKHPKWLELRAKIFARDQYTCRHCGAKDRPLCLHHIFYVKGRERWDYDPQYLLTLCNRCHDAYHRQHGFTSWDPKFAPKIEADNVATTASAPSVSVDDARPRYGFRKSYTGLTSASVRLTLEDYTVVKDLSHSMEVPIGHLTRPFVRLLVKFRARIAKCNNDTELEQFADSLISP